MKTIAIFSEKGGVGKTTLTAILASYLAYHKREQVSVLDFDCPSYQLTKMRETELNIYAQSETSPLRRFVSLAGGVPYSIRKVSGRGVYSNEELESVCRMVGQIKNASDKGYLLLDFPGRFLPVDAAYGIAFAGLIDLVVFPIDSDRQSISSAMYVHHLLNSEAYKKSSGKPDGQQTLFVWNRQTYSERRSKHDWYDEMTLRLKAQGLNVADERIRELLLARRDANSPGFIRSTLCFPMTNILRAAPYLPALFEEIVSAANDNKAIK